MVDLVKAEYDKRLGFWSEFSSGKVVTGLEPSVLREMGIYRGAAGIWIDKSRTAVISGDKHGVTVSVLHNGFSYDDDLADDCLIYHYPDTGRIGTTDASEIQATKNTKRIGFTYFCCDPSSSKRENKKFKYWVGRRLG